MNMNQVMNMVIRLFMRNVMNRGINAGMKGFSKLGKGRGGAAGKSAMTPEEREADLQARKTTKLPRR